MSFFVLALIDFPKILSDGKSPEIFDYHIALSLSFLHHCWLVVFHWSQSDSKFPQFSRTFLSILTNLNNAVVCLVVILPPISISSSFFLNLFFWEDVPSALTTIGITLTLMFHSFCSPLARSKYMFIGLLS